MSVTYHNSLVAVGVAESPCGGVCFTMVDVVNIVVRKPWLSQKMALAGKSSTTCELYAAGG